MESADYATLVDNASASDVYNNSASTVDQILAAAGELTTLIQNAKIDATLDGATLDDPKDGTSLITNASFDDGTLVNSAPTGWTLEGSTSPTSKISTTEKGDGVIAGSQNHWQVWKSSSIVADAYQTLEGIPNGSYTLSAAICPTFGSGTVCLFANDATTEVLSGQNQVYSVTTYVTDNTLKIGVSINATNSVTIDMDDFTLLYYGELDDPDKAMLDQYISEYTELYPYLDDIRANSDVKAAYEKALDDAENATSDYLILRDSLVSAATALATSISEYETVMTLIDYINNLCDTAEDYGWDGLVDNLADYRDELTANYESGDLTSGDIATLNDDVATMIADYIKQYCQAGDDITLLINNPSFDDGTMADNAPTGWTLDVETVPSTSKISVAEKGDGVIAADQNHWQLWTSNSIVGNAYQIIESVPNGAYTLSATLCPTFGSGTANLFVNTSTCDVTSGQNGVYSVTGYVTDNTLRIGLNMDASGGVTMEMDDFTLIYQGSDASAYADVMQSLIDEANDIADDGIIDQETDRQIQNAIAMAEEAMVAGTADDCITAIAALQESIANGKESIALAEKLRYLLEYIYDYRILDVESSYEGLADLIEELSTAFEDEEFESMEQISQYIVDLQKEFTRHVQYDHLDATKDNPADITSVINNPSFDYGTNDTSGATGWEFTYSGDHIGWSSATQQADSDNAYEFWNVSTFRMSQTIMGLAEGYYHLTCNALYRAGNNSATLAAAYQDAPEDYDDLTFFANEYTTAVANAYGIQVTEDPDITGEASIQVDNVTWYVPNTMQAAYGFFEAGYYLNGLDVYVEEGSDLVIGLDLTGNVYSYNWGIFDNFTISYLGSGDENAPTAIGGVEAEATNAAGKAIYDLSGRRVSKAQKGVYIIGGRKVLMK